MSTTHCLHTDYMTLALQLAERGRYGVSPNPMVGCVLVKNGQIIGSGFHQYAGEEHAEIHALAMAQDAAKDSTAYVTLEPCCHIGKTPPCTKALIAAGIKKVFVACEDPNPQVGGKGIQALRKAGIEVEVGFLAKPAKKLNEIFFHYMQHRRPFVFAKWAMSLDGKTIANAQDTRQISSAASQEATHLLRQQVDAILIGANTARLDNPLLTVRCQQNIRIKQPLRIILTTRGDIPLDLQIFAANSPSRTLVITTTNADAAWCATLKQRNIEILMLKPTANGQVDLAELLTVLGERGVSSLLVEGGMSVHHAFMQAHLINKIQVILAPVIIGPWEYKKSLTNLSLEKMGRDFHVSADIGETTHV